VDVLSRIRILTFFHSGSRIRRFFILDPGSYINRGMKSKNYQYRYLFSCFLWFPEEVLKVKKITHPGSGGKKAPDLRSGSKILLKS
jgi:hypothetical protein